MIDSAMKHYPELVHDLLRIASIQVAIHLMMCAEGSETFGDRSVVAVFLYTVLGILFYHLLAKVVLDSSVDSAKGRDKKEKGEDCDKSGDPATEVL